MMTKQIRVDSREDTRVAMERLSDITCPFCKFDESGLTKKVMAWKEKHCPTCLRTVGYEAILDKFYEPIGYKKTVHTIKVNWNEEEVAI